MQLQHIITMVIKHTGITAPASDITALAEWYESTLATLGYKKTHVFLEGAVNGFSDRPNGTAPDFWVSAAKEGIPTTTHHAFVAKSGCPLALVFAVHLLENLMWPQVTDVLICLGRSEVEAFHRAGIEAGGKDNGAPGLRPQYAPGYYAAFVLDLVGNNIEAVYIEDD